MRTLWSFELETGGTDAAVELDRKGKRAEWKTVDNHNQEKAVPSTGGMESDIDEESAATTGSDIKGIYIQMSSAREGSEEAPAETCS